MNYYSDRIKQIKQKLETELAASLNQREQKHLADSIWGDSNLKTNFPQNGGSNGIVEIN